MQNFKERVRWCHKEPIILDYWSRTIERQLKNLGVKIYDVEIMTHILPNLPEEYENTIEFFRYY